MSLFEIMMLICFGVAWPFSIHKSVVSKSVKGKSFVFLLIIWFGYVAGVLHKIFYYPDIVIVFYAINLTLVSVDVLLYLRNKRITHNKSLV